MAKRDKILTLKVCPKCNTTLEGNCCPSCGYKKPIIRKRFIVAFVLWLLLMALLMSESTVDSSELIWGGGVWFVLLLGSAWITLVAQNFIVWLYKEIMSFLTQRNVKERARDYSAPNIPNSSGDVTATYEPQETITTIATENVSEEESKPIGYDAMDGHDFEYFCADILSKNGYSDVEVTKGSGDQGIDIIAFKDDIKYGIQCKRYSSTIGNKAVQEAFAGKTFYGCHVAAVLTNQYFSASAVELAQKNGVLLWNRDKLDELIEEVDPSLKGSPIRLKPREEIDMSKKKYCKYCGELIDIDCVVCPKCGKQVEILATKQPQYQYRQNDRPIIINNSSSASASSHSYVNTGYRRKLPWYLRTSWIIILGFFTASIYWFVGPILRIIWRSHN